ncbi:IS5 family transposase [uncultured Meiothermus sp.]|uniref:IS5 family transposase n=1 Tax=uncultured Meiothermus sp. TaxID=157471 RepID=UPI00260524A0|nr:IS5 family transposase [uncultured Meiothermus sp.]
MTNRKTYLTDLQDSEWAVIEPELPKANQRGRPRKHSLREILNAIFYVVKNGCVWAALPHDLPAYKTVYGYFRAWCLSGLWKRVNDCLRRLVRRKAKRRVNPSAAIIDSQAVKSGEGGVERGFDVGKLTWGRKRHILVDTLGLLLGVLVSSAGVQDRDGARSLFEQICHDPWRRMQKVWADGAYAGELIRWLQHLLGWTLEIVDKLPGHKGFQVLPRRWVVERTFAWITRNRRLARDYERLPRHSEAFIYAAMIRLMLKRLP